VLDLNARRKVKHLAAPKTKLEVTVASKAEDFAAPNGRRVQTFFFDPRQIIYYTKHLYFS
jgi:hypothetical protein